MQKRLTVPQILRELNTLAAIALAQSSYTAVSPSGVGNDWVGAELIPDWYRRNGKNHAAMSAN